MATVYPHDSYDSGGTFVIGSIPITVVQSSRTANNIFNIVVSIMIMLNNINMGCALDLNAVKSVLKRPVGPFVGALCQFVAMPLVIGNFCSTVSLVPINIKRQIPAFIWIRLRSV